ncbi:ectonucleotide pyrophosphatase phosphodiesterase [Chamberlinius hualienensis]
MATLAVLVVLFVCQVLCDDNKVLIISFDGFRHDYLTMTETPNFDQLIAGGVKAPWIEPRFITKTFPNHHSIATGLYEESHGIVANIFYDPIINKTFEPKSIESEWWDTGAVPLWITNQENGGVSGGNMWPGVEAPIRNQTPIHLLPFNNTLSWFVKVDYVIKWLTDAEKPANLIYLYFNEPDSTGHEYGPESTEIKEAIKRTDNITGYLISQLKNNDLFDKVNIIITSDHGMTSTPSEKFIDLNSILVPHNNYQLFSSSPVLHVLPKEGQFDHVYNSLVNATQWQPFTVYKKEEIPEEYHYRNNRRIMPILLVADEHWAISESIPTELGNHGYNNSLPSMRPFFVAHGPAFKSGFVSKPFRNIDIYPLACYILSIQPMPNNGSLDNVVEMLISPPSNNIDHTVIIVVAVLLVLCLLGAIIGIVLAYKKYKKQLLSNADEEEMGEEQRLISSSNDNA